MLLLHCNSKSLHESRTHHNISDFWKQTTVCSDSMLGVTLLGWCSLIRRTERAERWGRWLDVCSFLLFLSLFVSLSPPLPPPPLSTLWHQLLRKSYLLRRLGESFDQNTTFMPNIYSTSCFSDLGDLELCHMVQFIIKIGAKPYVKTCRSKDFSFHLGNLLTW